MTSFEAPHHPTDRPRWWRRPIVLIAATITLGIAAMLPGQAAASPNARLSRGTKPTIVLVHGAWADASSWSAVVLRLQAAGYRVAAPPNPLRGLGADSTSMRAYLATISGPIVLVGHSYGGAVITDAATGNPNVKALVYVDAFAPDAGETLLDLVGAQPGSALAADPATVFDAVPIPGTDGDADTYLKPTVFEHAFAQDLPARVAAQLAASQRPLAASTIAQPSGEPAWRSIPSWYLVGTADRVIPPAEQLAMAHRAGSHVTGIDASHASPISRPGAVVRLVVLADRGTR
jgi:pimeloyl-ACP methyl ester carboxylesterase